MLTRSHGAAKRVLERLDRLYEIGGGGGANRIGGSPDEDAAHDLVARWMGEAGLRVERDSAGNLYGIQAGEDPSLPAVWTGSHVDSVPNGGRFDGTLGVVAGLEAVAGIGRRRRTLAVVVFRDEERGCFGSRAAVASGRLPGTYVEAHVEQGPVLLRQELPLGVVTGIAGIVRAEVAFEGKPGHAGTTPMSAREDALCAAAEYILRVRETARSLEGGVATVGRVAVEPGAANVIPGRVTLSVDARAPDAARLTALVDALGLEPHYRMEPVAMADGPRGVLVEEIDRLGLPVVELASGAGHDAGVLAAAGVEAGMLFVRSLNGGASHSPEEESSPEDVALCVDVLAAALARLAS